MGLNELFEMAAGSVLHTMAKNGWIKPPFEEADKINASIITDPDYDRILDWWWQKTDKGIREVKNTLVGFDVSFIHEMLTGHDESVIQLSGEDVGSYIWDGVVPSNHGNILSNAKQTYDMMVADALRGAMLSTDLITCYHRTLTAGELYDGDCGVYRSSDMTEGIDYRSIPTYMEKSIKQSREFLDFHQTKNYVLLAAAYMYCMIYNIMPYTAYNDMIAKLIVNFVLLYNNMPPVCIYAEDIPESRNCIDRFAEHGDITSFMYFVRKQIKKTWSSILS